MVIDTERLGANAVLVGPAEDDGGWKVSWAQRAARFDAVSHAIRRAIDIYQTGE